jgi:hypothetical protein
VRSLDERIRSAPVHTGGEFDAHLEGTAALLRDWGCRRELEHAGRYHSVYGNPRDREPLASAANRELIATIGVEAEQLVQLWAVVDRRSIAKAAKRVQRAGDTNPVELRLGTGESTVVSAQQFSDLVHLHAANELEITARSGATCSHLDPLRLLLCERAVALLDTRLRKPLASRLAAWLRRFARKSMRAAGAR